MAYLYQTPSFDYLHSMKVLCSNYFVPIYGKQINLNKIEKDIVYKKQGTRIYGKSIQRIGLGLFMFMSFTV